MSGSAALDPKPAFAGVAATNAAITDLAKAFAAQGIKDGIQVNGIVPGAAMTGRRRSFLEKWAPAHNMSVEDAMNKFPAESGISRYGQPEEVAELLGFMVSSAAKWMTGTSLRWMAERLKVFSGIPQAAERRSYVRYRPGDRRPLGASLRHKRSTVPLIDGLLAAMAIHHNLTLVTRNTRDMARTGVALFIPWSDKGYRRSGYANELLELRASQHKAAHGLSRGA